MIDVLNWSFENPVMADGANKKLDDSGAYSWYDSNGSATFPNVYIYDVSAAQFPSGAPHGSNAIQLDVRDPGTTNSIVQRNLLSIDGTQSYILTVKVGRSATEAFPVDYYVRPLKDTAVAAEFDVDEERAAHDVAAFVDELVAAGCVI